MDRTCTLGMLAGIFIAVAKGEPMRELTTAMILPEGIEGDRYALGTGAYSKANPPKIRHVTFIDEEQLRQGNAKLPLQYRFRAEETRRNLVTRRIGMRLNELVGRRFMVGSVIFEGVELCDPCDRPSNLVKKPGFKDAYAGLGGLRARVIQGGAVYRGISIWR